jgi:S1-C subfamily serine protease
MIGGDLIVAINGDSIGDQQDLANVMNKHRSGDTVSVTFYRGRKKMSVQVVLGEAHERA